jgi:hypothetical protein
MEQILNKDFLAICEKAFNFYDDEIVSLMEII